MEATDADGNPLSVDLKCLTDGAETAISVEVYDTVTPLPTSRFFMPVPSDYVALLSSATVFLPQQPQEA
jgi:hypothetical protein